MLSFTSSIYGAVGDFAVFLQGIPGSQTNEWRDIVHRNVGTNIFELAVALATNDSETVDQTYRAIAFQLKNDNIQ